MDLLNILLANKDSAGELGRAVGLDETTATSVVAKLLPALTQGLQKNMQGGAGVEQLADALKKGGHERYVENPAALTDAAAIADGNGILGHLLGSKDASRQLAAQVGAQTGVDDSVIKKLLPMVAALAMGTLSKKTDGGEQLRGGAGDVLGALLGGASSGDGGGLSAVAGLAKKFL